MTETILAIVLLAQTVADLPQFSRISFSVPFPEERGGGSATGLAGRLEYLRQDYVVASDGVQLRYRNLDLQADRIEVDLEKKTAIAEGGVILDEGPRRLAGERVEFDLDESTGTVYEASGYVHPDLYFTGKEVIKESEDVYVVKDGILTSCDTEVPAWSFRVSKARVRAEGFARVYNTRMRVKRLPFLYVPFLMFPAKSERASGFLFPNFGYSERRGTVVGAAWFQTLGPSYDTTIYADYYDVGFAAVGNEFRYKPSVDTEGILETYFIDSFGDGAVETGEEEEFEGGFRWRANWRHASDNLPFGLRGVINYADFSDFQFFRDFSRSFDDISIRQIGASGYLAGNWGRHAATLLLEQREIFINNDNTITRRQLPELEYRLNQTQLGELPMYLSVLASTNFFSVGSATTEADTWGRADVAPRLTVPIPSWPWLSISLAAAGRATYYDDSLPGQPEEGEEPEEGFTGESLTRTFGSANATVVGPSFSRVFHKGMGSFGKFKHIVEPRWTYNYSGDFEDQDKVPLFDEVDRIRPFQLATFSLVNRLLAKPADESNPYGAREIASFELSQSYSLDEEQPLQVFGEEERSESPISARLRFSPSLLTSVDAGATYNTLFGNFNNFSLSARTAFGRLGKNNVGLTWFMNFDPQTGETTTSQVRASAGVDIWRDRLRMDALVNYDVELGLLQQQAYVIQYNAQCYGLRLELREFESQTRSDRDVRFALSLKNIGTFIDLNTSTRSNSILDPGSF